METPVFTKAMRKEYTIIAPDMSPIHFGLIENVFKKHGYKLKMLDTTHDRIVTTGLQNVHNDTCYPALLIVGQLLEAIKSGDYDPHKLAVMMTQTGGGCRASNYINLIRRALRQNGYEYIPVVSLSATNLEKNPGFKLGVGFLANLLYCVHYGDALMLLSNQTRPYEVNEGDTEALIKSWTERLNAGFKTFLKVRRNTIAMISDFAAIKLEERAKIKVGIVGEIYMKYAPLGNNQLAEFLRKEGAEVVIPCMMDFMLYCCNHRVEDREVYGVFSIKQIGALIGERFLLGLQNSLIKHTRHSKFTPPAAFRETKKLVEGYVGTANKMGEGWLLTAEMLELVHSGVENIVCAQPFGCLPNHIVGKGMVRKIMQNHPHANIVTIDYDPGATKINQENRLKLMLAIAKENGMQKAEFEEEAHVASPSAIPAGIRLKAPVSEGWERAKKKA